VILGAGGHAKVLIDALRAGGSFVPYGVLDSRYPDGPAEVLGVPVLGDDSLLAEMAGKGVSCFAVGVGSTGDAGPRRRLYALGLSHHLGPVTVIHPAAWVSPWAKLGAGCQLFAGGVVNAGARLGVNVIVNTGAIVEHDCVIGDHAHIATGACLAGAVEVGEGAHVGSGAAVRQQLRIGRHAVVGTGAVVVKDVPEGVVVAGVPARVLREIG
jgi:UDP-perosamine 4-acetyltransferase